LGLHPTATRWISRAIAKGDGAFDEASEKRETFFHGDRGTVGRLDAEAIAL
jgi:hypothetical protein